MGSSSQAASNAYAPLAGLGQQIFNSAYQTESAAPPVSRIMNAFMDLEKAVQALNRQVERAPQQLETVLASSTPQVSRDSALPLTPCSDLAQRLHQLARLINEASDKLEQTLDRVEL